MENVGIALVAAFVVFVIVSVLRNVMGGARIDSATAKDLVKKGATLVDVRTPQEFSGGHIKGAINIPVAQIGSRAGEISKKKPVVVYCRSGARSGQAASILSGKGYDVHNLGPMSAW